MTQASIRFVAKNVGKKQFGAARSAITKILIVGLLGAAGVGITYLLLGRVIGEKTFGAPALGAITALVAAWMAVVALQTTLAEISFGGIHDIRLATVFGGVASWLVLIVGLCLLWLMRIQVPLPLSCRSRHPSAVRQRRSAAPVKFPRVS